MPRFAIIGSGGVGGYFGAKLARAGHETIFVARGQHLEAIRQAGLRIEEPDESFVVGATATDDTEEIGCVDYIVFAVKLWDAEAAATACRCLVGAETTILPLQNGVDATEIVATAVPGAFVLGGVAEISATIEHPGLIGKATRFHRIRLGETNGRRTDRATRLADALADAGIDVEISEDINRAIWSKFIFLTGLSALTTLTRRSIGEVRSDAETRSLLVEVMREATKVADAAGIVDVERLLDGCLALIDSLDPALRASMAIDHQRGNRLELPWLSGAVVRRGGQSRIPTPANSFVCKALNLDVLGSRAGVSRLPNP